MKIAFVKWDPGYTNEALLEKDHKLYMFSLFPYRRIEEKDLTPVPSYFIAVANWHEITPGVVNRLGLEL